MAAGHLAGVSVARQVAAAVAWIRMVTARVLQGHTLQCVGCRVAGLRVYMVAGLQDCRSVGLQSSRIAG